MLKLICLLPCLLVFCNLQGYGFEIELQNYSPCPCIIDTTKLRNIEVFFEKQKIEKLEFKPGDKKTLMFIFSTQGKNAEYGDVILKQAGIFGCKVASFGFVVPEFSDYVVPALNRTYYINRIINNNKGVIVEKTFDHSYKRYILKIGKKVNSKASNMYAC